MERRRHLLKLSSCILLLASLLLGCEDQAQQESRNIAAEREKARQEQAAYERQQAEYEARLAREEAARQALERRQDELSLLQQQTLTEAPLMAEQVPAAAEAASLDAYQTRLAVDAELTLPGPPAEMRVWIGRTGNAPDIPQGMASDSAALPMSSHAASARVEPYAPAFTIEPENSACIAVDPSGAEVRFSLTPKESGTFRVSASVNLYPSADCSGIAVPKSTTTLNVRVAVNAGGLIGNGLQEMAVIFWQKLIEFWQLLTGLIFGLLLFLIRGKLKRLFGYEDGKS